MKEEFPPCGFVKDAEGNVITKHDKEVMERRNTNKVMQVRGAFSLLIEMLLLSFLVFPQSASLQSRLNSGFSNVLSRL